MRRLSVALLVLSLSLIAMGDIAPSGCDCLGGQQPLPTTGEGEGE